MHQAHGEAYGIILKTVRMALKTKADPKMNSVAMIAPHIPVAPLFENYSEPLIQ